MKKHRRLIIGGILLIGFGVMAFLNFGRTMTPYVSFAEAKASHRAVQVAGFPDHAKARFDMASGSFEFPMTNEEGEVLPVRYRGAEPGNFSQAQSVVVVGRYRDGVFQASQILVKCPSKYEARGSQHPGEASAAPATGSKSSSGAAGARAAAGPQAADAQAADSQRAATRTATTTQE